MNEIAQKGGLKGNYTNHSGKRSCATKLYNSGVPEQEIRTRTGHPSETALRKYNRSSEEILRQVSGVLNPNTNLHPVQKQVKHADSQNKLDKAKENSSNILSDITNKTVSAMAQW